MSKATAQTIINLTKERDVKLGQLILDLNSIVTNDSTPKEHRTRREAELRAEYAGLTTEYAKRISQAATEAAEEPGRRLHAGTPHAAEELAEAQLYVTEYTNKASRQERDQLKVELAADLRAGNLPGARAKARAAKTLGIPLGELETQLLRADPAKRDAADSLSVIKELVELAGMEPIRMRAEAGYATAAEQMVVKEFAAERKLRWDTSLMAQTDPNYTGPGLSAGVPLNAFAERPDAERERQQATVRRIGRDPSTPDETAARYAARSDQQRGTDNLRLTE